MTKIIRLTSRTLIIKFFFAFSFFFILCLSLAAQTPKAWTPESQMKIKLPGTPRVSPDGKRVVYTVDDAVMTPDKSEFIKQIWLATTDGKENFQITFGEESSFNPKWSPDSSAIAFTSNRKNDRDNLYLLRLNGGEAEALTDLKSGVRDFEFSPDGRWIAFTMTDPKSEEEEKNDKARNNFRWVGENLKMSRLYLIPVDKDGNGKREPRKLTSENYHVKKFDWSPDGTKIVFSHTKTASVNDSRTSDVSMIDVPSGKATVFTATPAAEDAPAFSPDGKSIAVLVSGIPVGRLQSVVINIFPVAGGAPKVLPASYDSDPRAGFIWSADGRKIYFSEPKGTVTQIYAVDVAANRIKEIKMTQTVLEEISLNRNGTMFGFVSETSDTPPEVFVADANNFSPVQISRVNADLPKIPLGKTEVIRWRSSDGKEIEGLLTYPAGYQAGTRVPLLLNIHGGPAAGFMQFFIGRSDLFYPFAALASRGYAILRPNPRGSYGYGIDFRRANFKDWGGGDYQDLMTGVDKVIEMGVADKDRLGVMGWSYGGYMTLWTVTQTKRFKAASAGAPITNLVSMAGTTDIQSYLLNYFGGQFWENPEIYMKHSPIFHVKGVTTPTMIQHGEADIRVPISQGYEFYNALKAQGVPVRMLVLPRQSHGIDEPKMVLSIMQANVEWFEKYLGDKTTAD